MNAIKRGVWMARAGAFTMLLVAALAGAVGCAGAPDGQGPSEGQFADVRKDAGAVRKISADEAHDLMVSGKVAVLDVRTADEYAERHIVNARLLPLDAIDAKTAEEVAPDKDAPVLVYCRSGVRSAEAAQKLSDLGYAQVYDFGGILDWPYATVEGAETVQSGLPEGEMPVGVKVVCGKTRSLPED